MADLSLTDSPEARLSVDLARELAQMGARHVITMDLTGISAHNVAKLSNGFTAARGKPMEEATLFTAKWHSLATHFAQCFELALATHRVTHPRFQRLHRAMSFVSAYRAQLAIGSDETLPLDLAYSVMKGVGIGRLQVRSCITCAVPSLSLRVTASAFVHCTDHSAISLDELYQSAQGR